MVQSNKGEAVPGKFVNEKTETLPCSLYQNEKLYTRLNIAKNTIYSIITVIITQYIVCVLLGV